VRRFLIAEILAFILLASFFNIHPLRPLNPQKANPLPNFLLPSAIKAIVLVIAPEPRNLVFIRKNITLLRTIPNGRKSQKA
jgi:hypothetical protein